MLFCLNKYISRQPKEAPEKKMVDMLSPCAPACASACCAAPFLAHGQPANPTHRRTTTRAARSDFSKATTSSFFPNTQFTNHESLPGLHDAFAAFVAAYPKYRDSQGVDAVRDSEYQHLSSHVCLDYAGFSLFSHHQMHSSDAASSSSSPPPLLPPFFDISYRSASLKTQVRYGSGETPIESAIRKRIMSFLNISGDDYTMVCTANRTSAFKLLAESYPFHSNKRLLTVYDYHSEAVAAMEESAIKKGAKIMSASFAWPGLRIDGDKLKKMISARKKKQRGLFVFPLQSRMSGARYPYIWMSSAQENGWNVVLDAGALGPKDMDTLGISLIQPDFLICSFYKVFGENPSGFAGLFIKKSSSAVLQSSAIARSIGVVSLVPSRRLSRLQNSLSDTDQDERSFSGPLMLETPSSSKQEQDVTSTEQESREFMELKNDNSDTAAEEADKPLLECRSLDQADSMGLLLISSRMRYITNWLVIALMKLRHPHSDNGHYLVRIYGPRIKFDRAPALAFNVFDWKGEKVEPALVQKLADRSNISLTCGFLRNICFSDKYEEQQDGILERRVSSGMVLGNRGKENQDLGVNVVNVSIGFLTNFEDVYRLWAFVAKFLDADFVEKERWRYMALDQRMVEV